MAYDQDLANRIRELAGAEEGISEMSMFGGLAFLIDGNMAVAVSGKGGLMVRCEPGETEALMKEPGAGPFEMRGRELDGWLRVDAGAVATQDELRPWVDKGIAYARSLPPKA
jgi:hypothetical protein